MKKSQIAKEYILQNIASGVYPNGHMIESEPVLSEKLKIEYEKNNFVGEIGVRIEMPYNIFNSIDKG